MIEVNNNVKNIGELVVYLLNLGYKLEKTGNHGFHVEAGHFTVSVQCGITHYCSSRGLIDHRGYNYELYSEIELFQSENAEIAAWNTQSGQWVRLDESDDVLGYVSPQFIMNLMRQYEMKAALSS